MLIQSNVNNSENIAKSCIRFADRLGLTVIENENLFSIKECEDGEEEVWFDRNNMTNDDLDSFIYLCRSYVDMDKHHWVPDGFYVFLIDCPNCHRCKMTEAQIHMNRIQISNNEIYIVCVNCGEIMKLKAV